MNKNNEWYTPDFVLDRAREVLGCIDLDPATAEIANERVQADDFFTEEDNGLDKEWFGNVWCNPPYSASLIKKFTKKCLDQYNNNKNISSIIILTNSGTDTQWNLPLQEGVQVYTNGRISFLQPDGTEKGKGGRGQCFTYFGDEPKKFIEVFTRDGFCWCPNKCLIN